MTTSQDNNIEQLKRRAAEQKKAESSAESTSRTSRQRQQAQTSSEQSASPRSSGRTATTRSAEQSSSTRTSEQITRSPRASASARPQQPSAQPRRQTAPKPSPQKPRKQRKPAGPERFFWYAMPIFFIGAFILISCISYLKHWQADQDIASWDLVTSTEVHNALNWGGRVGAVISENIIGDFFGIFGLLLPVVIIIISIKILSIKSFRLHKTIRSITAFMLIGSVAMGHFFGININHFGSGLGGEMGIYIAQWFTDKIGFEGTALLIALLSMAVIYFTSWDWIRRTISSISNYFEKRRELRESKLERDIAQAKLEAIIAAEQASAMAKQKPAAAISSTKEVSAVSDTDNQPAQQEKVTESSSAKIDEYKNTQIITGPSEETSAIKSEETSAKTTMAHANPHENSTTAHPLDENMILLDNGQYGYITGADENGEITFCYFDSDSVAKSAISSSSAIANQPAVSENEEPDTESIEFIIKTRPAEEPEYPIQEKKSSDSSIVIDTQSEVAYPKDTHIENISKALHSEAPDSDHTDKPSSSPSAELSTTRVVHFAPSPGDPNFIVEQTISEEQIDDQTINLTEVYDPTLELRNYQKPPVELLRDHSKNVTVTDEELIENKNRIVETLGNFGIEIKSIEATTGPTVTLYEIIPAPGVRISKIKNLEEDIALSLSALGIRIIAPIPGKGTIGIEVPNKNKEIVSMYSVIRSSRFQDTKYDLPIALGKNIQNETVVMDLAKMPHLLVAGATGQGKSVGLNAVITSLLYKKHPAELKFVLVDPKKVELTLYAKLEKHFLAKMPDEDKAIITDTQKVIHTLNSVCIEMSDRYDLLEAAKVRNVKEYNEKFINRRLNPEKGHRFMPYFVVIIDEFADLIMTAGREVETPIARIAQLARAVGIHLIIATQRPSVNIITGVIRANFPARIAFRVATATDSRTILDTGGANQLVGQGDMLVSNGNEIVRVQCAFIDTPEVDAITEHISSQKGYPSAYELPEYIPEGESTMLSSEDISKRDSLFEEVARYVVTNQTGSASTIQRKFSIGFNRAGRIVDQLEAAGVLGKSEGSKPRQVLISDLSTLDIMIG